MAQNPPAEARLPEPAPAPSGDAVEPRPDPPAGRGSRGAAPTGRTRRPFSFLGKRKTFLVNRRSQLRAGFLTAAAALILLLLLNLSLYSARRSVTDSVLADSPELGQILHAQNRVELALVVTASIVFLVGVFVVTVLETHKTAGAAFNLARHMSEIRHGQYSARIRLRKDDNLRELETAFNDMGRALQDRAWQDVERLEHFASVAESLAGPDEARELAAVLREFAQDKRRLAD